MFQEIDAVFERISFDFKNKNIVEFLKLNLYIFKTMSNKNL